jgi:photosystem II stability/assembly factor-like uncharacterized protein
MFFVFSCACLHSTQDSDHWKDIAPSWTKTMDFSIVRFRDEDNGWISTGDCDSIVRTGDAGRTWTQLPIKQPKLDGRAIRVCSVFFLSEQEGWGVGLLDGKGRGTISRTSDGGKSWTLVFYVPESASNLFRDVYFLDDSVGFAVGFRQRRFGTEGTIWCTRDGGHTWHLAYATGRGGTELARIISSSGLVWTIGEGVVLRSDDVGLTWSEVYRDDSQYIFGIAAQTVSDVWITGQLGFLGRTANSGSTWSQVGLPLPFENNWFGAVLFDKGTTFLGGQKGGILYTDDNGSSWQVDRTPNQKSFIHDFALTKSQIIAVGDDGTILSRPRLRN